MKVRFPGGTQLDVSILRRAMRAFRPALSDQRGPMVTAVFLTIGLTALELLRPWPIKYVIDDVILGDGPPEGWSKEQRLLLACGVLATVGLLVGTINLWRTVVVANVGRKAVSRIRKKLFYHLHRLAIPFHQSSQSGDLLVRLMGDVNMVRDLLFASWVTILTQSLVFLAALVVLLSLSSVLGLVSLLPLPLLIFAIKRSTGELHSVVKKQRRKEGQAASMAAESLQQIHVVKSYAGEETISGRFGKQARAGERAGANAAAISAKAARWTEFLTGAGLALVVYVGAVGVLRGDHEPGLLVVIVSYTRALYKPLRGLTKEGTRLGRATACAGRLLDILETPAEKGDQGTDAPEFKGEIELSHVSFTWPEGIEALKDVSMRAPAGSLTLICGPNGSGKSTLLSLLLRLLRPTGAQSRITIDDQDVNEFSLDSYRRRFAYVPQGVQLFAGTLKGNILYGQPDASLEDVQRAIRLACLEDVVESLPDGLETRLGERGESLSGGESRRLMLARAALRDARILLLDEPLAGLDPEARVLVARSIRQIAAGRTTIVISHGSATDLDPDHTLHLDQGRLVRTEERSTP